MNVTVRESLHIRAAPERVWDFTQDWTRRALANAKRLLEQP